MDQSAKRGRGAAKRSTKRPSPSSSLSPQREQSSKRPTVRPLSSSTTTRDFTSSMDESTKCGSGFTTRRYPSSSLFPQQEPLIKEPSSNHPLPPPQPPIPSLPPWMNPWMIPPNVALDLQNNYFLLHHCFPSQNPFQREPCPNHPLPPPRPPIPSPLETSPSPWMNPPNVDHLLLQHCFPSMNPLQKGPSTNHPLPPPQPPITRDFTSTMDESTKCGSGATKRPYPSSSLSLQQEPSSRRRILQPPSSSTTATHSTGNQGMHRFLPISAPINSPEPNSLAVDQDSSYTNPCDISLSLASTLSPNLELGLTPGKFSLS